LRLHAGDLYIACRKLPFQASKQFSSLIYQITGVEPQPPSAHRPEVPQAIDEIVRRAMAKDLERRYAVWEDFSARPGRGFPQRSRRCAGQAARTHSSSPTRTKFETLRALPFFENFSDAEIWEVRGISAWNHARSGRR